MKKLQEKQDIIPENGKDIQNLNSESIISKSFNSSIIPYQKAMLQKMQADLTQQLKINQQELNNKNKKTYKRKESNSRNANHLILEINLTNSK